MIFTIRSQSLYDGIYKEENDSTVYINPSETKYILKIWDKGGPYDEGDNFLGGVDSLEVCINDSLRICKNIHQRASWDYYFEETSKNGKNGNNIYHLTINNNDTCGIQ